MYQIPSLPLAIDLETKEILRQLGKTNRALAELKGIAHTIPNEAILISTLALQEAKDSSAVENIVTTHDDIYKADLHDPSFIMSAAAKEVLNYREAIQVGFNLVRKPKVLTNNNIKEIQKHLEGNTAGFRAIPGTTLKNNAGEIVYTPPQDGREVARYMDNLEAFINNPNLCDIDPLIKMAIIHHQFESIHPFYDGNGRTGRIVSILYLVINDLLDLPILYLSRYITHNKSEYYRLIQAIRDVNDNSSQWHEWVLFMLKGVEQTASDTIHLIKGISSLMSEYKKILRPTFGNVYRHDLLNNLFFHPYIKIEYIEKDMQVQRKTASKYLDMIVETGLITKVKIGRSNYYINGRLVELFINTNAVSSQEETISTVQQ